MPVVGEATLELRGDSASLERALGRAQRTFQRVGQRMQSVGRTMSTAVTLPLAAVGAASIKMASDAEEAANKFDVVMGNATDRVRERLMALHDTVPLTTMQLEGLAAGVQDLLVPLGLARDRAADMSAEMVEVAGDLASFNNVAAEVPLEAIKSALAGMSRPLRQFGVDVSQSRLETLALSEGLITAGQEMDNAARAQAVMIAVQRDSTDAIGDAARTADSTANSLRFLARDVKELGITIGRILIPVVRPMLQHLRTALERFQEMSPRTQKVAVAIGALAAATGPLLLALGTLVTLAPAIAAGFAAITGPIGLAVVAFGALTAAGIALADNWGIIKFEVQRLVEGIRTWLVEKFGAIVDSVRAKIEAVTGFFRGMYQAVVGGSIIPDMVREIGEWMGKLGDTMGRPVATAVRRIQSLFVDLADKGASAFRSFVDSVIADIERLIAKLIALKLVETALNLIPGGQPFAAGVNIVGRTYTGAGAITPGAGAASMIDSGMTPTLAAANTSPAGPQRIVIDLANMPQPLTPGEAARNAEMAALFARQVEEHLNSGGGFS